MAPSCAVGVEIFAVAEDHDWLKFEFGRGTVLDWEDDCLTKRAVATEVADVRASATVGAGLLMAALVGARQESLEEDD